MLPETIHAFGVLDPSQPCRHTFIVRNEGTAPLKIAKAGTSCKCTVSVLPARDIPPSKGAPIEIESKIDETHGEFRHTAAFLTNDPKMPRFELTIEGEIRSYLAAAPAAVQLLNVEREKPVETQILIHSQIWNAFSLKEITSSLEGMTWEVEPSPREALPKHQAQAGYLATIRLPASVTAKSFSGWIEVVAECPDQPLVRKTIRVPVSGHVPPLRSLYGEQVDHEGVVTIGCLKPGEGATAHLLLQVRGEHREIRVREIRKTPDLLKVSVAPRTPAMAKKGLYNVMIEVPHDAPSCNHLLPGNRGEVRIVTDHPEMPEILRFEVAFCVMTR